MRKIVLLMLFPVAWCMKIPAQEQHVECSVTASIVNQYL